MKRSVWQRHFIIVAKIGVAGILLAWLALSGRLQLDRLASVSIGWNAAILLTFQLIATFLPMLRWWWLLRIQRIFEPFGKIAMLTWAGFFVSLILPGAASGDLARGYLILRQRDSARARAMSTVLADRFLGLYSLVCLGAFSLCWLAASGAMTPSMFVMVIATAVLWLLMTVGLGMMLLPTSRRFVLRCLPTAWQVAWDESFELYLTGILQVLGCLIVSLISSAMIVLSFGLAARLLGIWVSWNGVLLAGPLVVLSNCLPFTPGGIGIAETVSSGAFGLLGTDRGGEMMLLVRVFGALVSLPGLFGLLTLPTRPKNQDGQQNSVDSHPVAMSTIS